MSCENATASTGMSFENVISGTQQSISTRNKRKSSKTLRGGVTVGYKRPRQNKTKTVSFAVLFKSSGSIIERSKTTNRVLQSYND